MKYYIQRHANGYVGNCLLWWRKGGNGYTCNLDEAEVFNHDETKFQSIAKDESKYTAWKQDYIDSCAHRHVDHQYVNAEANTTPCRSPISQLPHNLRNTKPVNSTIQ